MSAFSEEWASCMRGNGFPVVDAKSVGEALEFVESIHSAWEKAGGDEKVTIGALIAAGAFAGLEKGALAILGEATAAVFVAYYIACITCMASVALQDLKNLVSLGKVPDFVVADLESQGIDIAKA
jgi:hypothetical protein